MEKSRDTGWRRAAADVGRTATQRGRTALGRYAIEGPRLHERAARAGVRVETVLVAESLREPKAERLRGLFARLRQAGSRILFAPDPVLERITEGRTPGAGLVGLVELPPAPKLEALVSPSSRLLIGCDVEEPGNVGALVRTALASGACAFVAVGSTDTYHSKAVRTSMGSLFKLPLLHRPDARAFLGELKAHGLRTIGAVSRGGTPLDRLAFPIGPIGLWVGSESRGLPPALIPMLDGSTTVPMTDEVDSFSVNAAAAIILFEITRQTARR